MGAILGLRCRECGREYPAEPIHVCEYCFAPLEVVYDYDEIRSVISPKSISEGPRSIWRYADLLPGGEKRVDLATGLLRTRDLRDAGAVDLLLLRARIVPAGLEFLRQRPSARAETVANPWDFREHFTLYGHNSHTIAEVSL